MIELIVEKGYDATSIQDILERADVSRATFYSHFYNKKDLLLGQMSAFQLSGEGADGNDPAARLPDATPLFEHAAGQKALYASIKGTQILEDALTIARNDLIASYKKALGTGGDEEHVEMLAQVLSGALLQLLIWWLENDTPESPESMNRWFRQIAAKMIAAA